MATKLTIIRETRIEDPNPIPGSAIADKGGGAFGAWALGALFSAPSLMTVTELADVWALIQTALKPPKFNAPTTGLSQSTSLGFIENGNQIEMNLTSLRLTLLTGMVPSADKASATIDRVNAENALALNIAGWNASFNPLVFFPTAPVLNNQGELVPFVSQINQFTYGMSGELGLGLTNNWDSVTLLANSVAKNAAQLSPGVIPGQVQWTVADYASLHQGAGNCIAIMREIYFIEIAPSDPANTYLVACIPKDCAGSSTEVNGLQTFGGNANRTAKGGLYNALNFQALISANGFFSNFGTPTSLTFSGETFSVLQSIATLPEWQNPARLFSY